MSVTSTDILQYLSSATSSTGGDISGSTTTSGITNNVWPDITDVQRVAGGILYRKTFWKNSNSTDAMILPIIYCPVFPTNMTLAIGLGVNNTSDSDSTQGNMSAWSSTAKVSVISDGGDTRTVTIYGMDNTGTPVPVTETVTLNGTSEVLSANTYSKVWAVWLSATDGARTVTVKQGAAGTVRGTIAALKLICWLWISAGTAKSSGIALPNLPAGQNYGVWRKLSWVAGATAVRPDTLSVAIEENG